MSQVMLLVSAEGATLAETRVDGERPETNSIVEGRLREEAAISGFAEDEVRSAHIVMAGDPPNQP